MLQLHKLPIFQWLEFLHLAQVIPGVLGDDSGFPDCFNFVVFTMATCDFQGGCRREGRIPRSFSGSSVWECYHFCSLPMSCCEPQPRGTQCPKSSSQGGYDSKGVAWFWRRNTLLTNGRVFSKNIGSKVLDSLPASLLHTPLVILLHLLGCENRSSLLPFIGNWDEFHSGPSELP